MKPGWGLGVASGLPVPLTLLEARGSWAEPQAFESTVVQSLFRLGVGTTDKGAQGQPVGQPPGLVADRPPRTTIRLTSQGVTLRPVRITAPLPAKVGGACSRQPRTQTTSRFFTGVTLRKVRAASGGTPSVTLTAEALVEAAEPESGPTARAARVVTALHQVMVGMPGPLAVEAQAAVGVVVAAAPLPLQAAPVPQGPPGSSY